MTRKYIGIHGRAKSGKDEFATICSRNFGFSTTHFAKPVKELAAKYFDVNPLLLEKKNKESRMILQGIGMCVKDYLNGNVNLDSLSELHFSLNGKVKKKYRAALEAMINAENFTLTNTWNGEYWVYRLLKNLTDNYNSEDVILIPDLRFKAEKDFVKSQGGICVKIMREDNPKIEHGHNHISEIDLDNVTDWDYVITNPAKGKWKDSLNLQSITMIKGLLNKGFLSEHDEKKFSVILD